MSVKIFAVSKNGICGKKGIRPGDMLVSVNSHEINDVLDYRFYSLTEFSEFCFQCRDGKNRIIKIRNNVTDRMLGISFETYLMDRHRHCKNSCIFCFIDQLPKGLRKSLYFKDDDSRLSFLFGNYITLTNLSDRDIDRIIKMHISPVNVSVHTMNPELRVKMMRNPQAGAVLGYLQRLSDAGIDINAQLVLCPGINDGAELRYSLEKLSELKGVKSIAAVPVGMTKFRDELFELNSYNRDSASEVIDIIDDFNLSLSCTGREKLAFPSDEFFLISGRDIPDESYYCEFLQLDNGVGMYALTDSEFSSALENSVPDDKIRNVSVATGVAAYPLIKKLAEKFMEKYPCSKVNVYCIENRFFGEKVTVAGLITGKDLIEQLKEKKFFCDKLLLPSVMFKSSSDRIFLDDISLEDVEKQLNTAVTVVDCDGGALFDSFYNS